MTFGHVGLHVYDLERSAAFYGDAFGFEIVSRVSRNEEWIGRIVGRPGVLLNFVHMRHPSFGALELISYEQPVHARIPKPWNVRHVHFCFVVEDIEAMMMRAFKAGAKILSFQAPVIIPDGPKAGTKVLYMLDPDEVVIELEERPK